VTYVIYVNCFNAKKREEGRGRDMAIGERQKKWYGNK
jgi:hypothetical protein